MADFQSIVGVAMNLSQKFISAINNLSSKNRLPQEEEDCEEMYEEIVVLPEKFPRKLEEKILLLLSTAERSEDDADTRSATLKALWDYVAVDAHKFSFVHPEYQFLFRLLTILHKAQADNDFLSLTNGVGCIWYLSREVKARTYICCPSLGLIPFLFQLISLETRLKLNILKTLSNCSLTTETHAYIFSPEFRYLDILRNDLFVDDIANNPNVAFAHQALQHCISTMNNDSLRLIANLNIHRYILNNFMRFPENPVQWPSRFSGVSYWTMNALMSFSSLPEGARLLHETGQYQAFHSVLPFELMESVKSFILLANLSPYLNEKNLTCESRADQWVQKGIKHSLINDYPGVFKLLVQVYDVIHNYQEDSPEVTNLVSKGFAFSIITLRDITSALKNLSYCPYCAATGSNNNAYCSSSIGSKGGGCANGCAYHPFQCHRKTFLENEKLLFLIYRSIELFIQNSPEFSTSGQVGAKVFSGGGGKDYDTMVNILEFLLQLSYYEEEIVEVAQKREEGESDSAKKRKWTQLTNGVAILQNFEYTGVADSSFSTKGGKNLPTFLRKIVSLPAKREIPTEIKVLTKLLLKRLEA
jgi:hypothetical protein